MTTLVSCIVPSYNYGRFLPRALDSIFAQTYPNTEVIVVDDGSTDDTQAVLKPYAGRIRVVKKANGGISSARNAGIEVARGELLAFLDADDWWEHHKIARQVEVMSADPRLGGCGVGDNLYGPEGTLHLQVPAQPFPTWQQNLRAVALRKLWIGASASGFFTRRAVLEDLGGFDTTLRAAEDWDMWMRLVSRYPIANLPEALSNRRWHGTGMFRNALLVEEAQTRAYQLAISRWPDVLDARMRRRMRALILGDAGGEFVASGNLDAGFRKHCAALATWPFEKKRWRPVLSLGLKRALATR